MPWVKGTLIKPSPNREKIWTFLISHRNIWTNLHKISSATEVPKPIIAYFFTKAFQNGHLLRRGRRGNGGIKECYEYCLPSFLDLPALFTTHGQAAKTTWQVLRSAKQPLSSREIFERVTEKSNEIQKYSNITRAICLWRQAGYIKTVGGKYQLKKRVKKRPPLTG